MIIRFWGLVQVSPLYHQQQQQRRRNTRTATGHLYHRLCHLRFPISELISPIVHRLYERELTMSSSCTSKTTDYYYQMRQKNNEAARNSRFKKKVAEIEISVQKRKLEVTYVQLKKEIKRIQICRYNINKSLSGTKH
ncbi:BZIP domain-containing protein [Aphis craccivora]|uniref:BZIP domain-containing protein n=1 Tax=Aphis craccivora TaxID=307492 RepID=A0A6G0ZPT4_APHCR|nr:BZIP domain-containing protein [Aphis craccivora]